jgi:type IX secretion system PorP/SprF family membrane protein
MRKLFLFISLIVFAHSYWAQQRVNSSLFSAQVPMMQPGWMGTRQQTEILVGARKQWLGWNGAPQTQYLSISSSLLNNKLGLGINLSKDKTGARRTNEGSLVVNYITPINLKGWYWSSGISLGYNRFAFDASNLLVADKADNNLNEYQSSPVFSFGFGTSLKMKNWQVGLYNNRLNNYLNSEVKPMRLNLINQWSIFSSYELEINSLLNLNSAVHLNALNAGKSNAEVNALLVYQDLFGIGLAYRYHESIGVPVQFKIAEQIQVLYAYDFPIQQMLNSQSGTHEIAINVQIKSKPKAVLNPRFF